MKRDCTFSLPVTVVVLSIAFVYFSTVFIFIDRWFGLLTSPGIMNAFAFTAVAVMCIFNYTVSIFTDPGRVPRTFMPDIEDSDTPIYEIKRKGGDLRYCQKCSHYKPPRAHHCRVCKRCVLRMDHHCIWINNCVGPNLSPSQCIRKLHRFISGFDPFLLRSRFMESAQSIPNPPSTQTLDSHDQNPPPENQPVSDHQNESGVPQEKLEALKPKPILSGNGLTNTNTQSGPEKDCSGGEEETSSGRRRRSRWDTSDSNDSGTGRKRKSRWADEEPKPLIQLPDFMKDFTGGIEFDPQVQSLNSRLLEISRMLQSGLLLDDRPEGARSPSPEPV